MSRFLKVWTSLWVSLAGACSRLLRDMRQYDMQRVGGKVNRSYKVYTSAEWYGEKNLAVKI
jgi:hypothetical protein